MIVNHLRNVQENALDVLHIDLTRHFANVIDFAEYMQWIACWNAESEILTTYYYCAGLETQW